MLKSDTLLPPLNRTSEIEHHWVMGGKKKGWWRWWDGGDNWSYRSCKAPVKSLPPTNQHLVIFTGRMPFLSPNQQCQSTEGNTSTYLNNHFQGCLGHLERGYGQRYGYTSKPQGITTHWLVPNYCMVTEANVC